MRQRKDTRTGRERVVRLRQPLSDENDVRARSRRVLHRVFDVCGRRSCTYHESAGQTVSFSKLCMSPYLRF